MFKLIIADKKGNWNMYKIDYTYLEDCDGGYSKAIDKIETVTQYMNNVVAPDVLGPNFRAVLAILGIKWEQEGRK